jgi:alpha-1,6-mannosyltransferase
VTLLPYQPDPRSVAALLASSDALVHAGRQETFGLVALEAMAAGIPVVAYAAGALPELIDDAVGRLASPKGPRALAEAVVALFDSDAAALGRAARARVLERYSWDAAFEGELRHYARLLDTVSLLRPADTRPAVAT